MTEYVPIPILAELFSSAPASEIARDINALSSYISDLYSLVEDDFYSTEEENDPEVLSVLETHITGRYPHFDINSSPQRTKALSMTQFRALTHFLLSNAKMLGDDKEACEEWLGRGAVRGYEGGVLQDEYLEAQPLYQPGDSETDSYEWLVHSSQLAQLRERAPEGQLVPAEDRLGRFPSLTRALRPFVSDENPDAEAAGYVVVFFMCLGVTVAETMRHLLESHNVRHRGFEYRDHLRYIIQEVEREVALRISDWDDELPLRVRQVLAQQNFATLFKFLADFVFRQEIAPRGSSVPPQDFAPRLIQWISRAISSTEVDPQGRGPVIVMIVDENGRLINSNGTGDISQTQPYSLLNICCPPTTQPQMGDEPPSDESSDSVISSVSDVSLEATGDRIPLDDHAALVPTPPEDSQCTICLTGYDDQDQRCFALNECGHAFHETCLDGWINAVHKDRVNCPNCRVLVCQSRTRRRRREQQSGSSEDTSMVEDDDDVDEESEDNDMDEGDEDTSMDEEDDDYDMEEGDEGDEDTSMDEED